MEYIYRFRPITRLLKEDGISGELDSLYIFFADPKTLNDPLEGHKNLIFRGDIIVWNNLLKHYIRCLTVSCLKNIDNDPEGTTKDIDIFISTQSSPAELKIIYEKIFDEIKLNSALSEYFERVGEKREICSPELIGHLNLIHVILLASTLKILKSEGLFGPNLDLDFFENMAKSSTQKISVVLGEIRENGGQLSKQLEDILKRNYKLYSELQLLNRYLTPLTSEQEPAAFVLFEFPEVFVSRLNRLAHPDWYVACFMESCNDSSIWGTYGSNHSDVCLKFKVKDKNGMPSIRLNYPSGYSSKGVTYKHQDIAFKKVSYDKDFVDIDFFGSLGNLSMPQIEEWYYNEDGEMSTCGSLMFNEREKWRDVYWKKLLDSYQTKNRDWSREQEWRLVLHSYLIDFAQPDSRKLQYTFDSLEGIIFGINTSIKDKVKIIQKINTLCEKHKRPEFNFYQAFYDEATKSISHELLPRIRVGHSGDSQESS